MSQHEDVISIDCTGKTSLLESDSRDATLGKDEVQARPGQRFLVRVTSYRKRLLDEDNLCEKYHIDLLRYASALPGDEASQTKIETSQVKVGKGEEERTEIAIYQI